jgi:hypothetical protein
MYSCKDEVRKTYKIHENINLNKFIELLFDIISEEGIVHSPKSYFELLTFYCDSDGVITSISITDKRVNLKEPWNEDSNYFLDCTEYISYDNREKVIKHNKYKFHFNSQSNEFKNFRIDYNPGQDPEIHAHDNNYKISNEDHLTCPEDIELNLTKIDIINVLSIMKNYINNNNEYPLNNSFSTKYNGIITKNRKEYDDRV